MDLREVCEGEKYEKMYSNVQFKNRITLMSACPLSYNLFLREI